MDNPYQIAVDWIEKNPGTGSANGLVKLIFSLWNDDAAFSFRECISNFDDIRDALALKIVTHFVKNREDRFLCAAAERLYKIYPHIWDEGYAGSQAKYEFRNKR